MTFEFSIIASGLDPEADDFESRFFDAGCDDATVAFQKGHIIVDFAREAESMDDAITSAMANVRAAGAQVDRIEPDPLVSLSEIAERVGLTRAALTNYAKGERGTNFPAPVARVTSNSSLWDYAEVTEWLRANGTVSDDVVVAAHAVRKANAALAKPA